MKAANEVIERPLLTEKGTHLKDAERKVQFVVRLEAKKPEIQKAIEELFQVRVQCVRTQIVRGKTRRMGRFVGRRPSWKKAIVTLAEGHDIDFFALPTSREM